MVDGLGTMEKIKKISSRIKATRAHTNSNDATKSPCATWTTLSRSKKKKSTTPTTGTPRIRWCGQCEKRPSMYYRFGVLRKNVRTTITQCPKRVLQWLIMAACNLNKYFLFGASAVGRSFSLYVFTDNTLHYLCRKLIPFLLHKNTVLTGRWKK